MNLIITIVFCSCIFLFICYATWREIKEDRLFEASLADIRAKAQDAGATREELIDLDRQLINLAVKYPIRPHVVKIDKLLHYIDGRLQGCRLI